MPPATDEHAALAAIATLDTLSPEQQDARSAVNTIIQNGEPFVNVHELFAHYNVLYFRRLLLPHVEVLWSPRLTLCAGICELSRDPTTKNYTRIRLKLSTPLLQYRPRSDTINTLLHEAIHAYFFLTTSWAHSRGDDGTGHGVGFQLLADAINNHGQYEVTIYHTFHDEVESYRTHVWQCNGPCAKRPPYFGTVKRSMNRAPGKGDSWWKRHEEECGGAYTKIGEPKLTKKQIDALSKGERAGRQRNKLDGWVVGSVKKGATGEGATAEQAIVVDGDDGSSVETSESAKKMASKFANRLGLSSVAGQKRSLADDTDVKTAHDTAKKMSVECPICNSRVAETDINKHLDRIHS
ncbi:hypothetical protein NX059_006810 [Plenodomus lindquistii]|nr:hypothetical protein NX059_006810 [Plenodomus lindquistii]